MKFHLSSEVRFSFLMPKTIHALLVRLSNLHYDATCREMSYVADRKQGTRNGFLTIVAMNLGGEEDSENFNVFGATFRQLDLCLKVAEFTQGLVSKSEAEQLRKFCSDLRFALRESNNLAEKSKADIDSSIVEFKNGSNNEQLPHKKS